MNSLLILLVVALLSATVVQSILVEIVSVFGNPLTAELDGELTLNRDSVSEWEAWDLLPNEDGTVSFRSAHGKYLSGDPEGNLKADRDEASEWEKFIVNRMSEHDNDKVNIQSIHHYFLCANHQKMEPRAEAGEWETFTLRPIERQMAPEAVTEDKLISEL